MGVQIEQPKGELGHSLPSSDRPATRPSEAWSAFPDSLSVSMQDIRPSSCLQAEGSTTTNETFPLEVFSSAKTQSPNLRRLMSTSSLRQGNDLTGSRRAIGSPLETSPSCNASASVRSAGSAPWLGTFDVTNPFDEAFDAGAAIAATEGATQCNTQHRARTQAVGIAAGEEHTHHRGIGQLAE